MTPAARVQAAIAVLDQIGAGIPAEKSLTNWARGARYAGSRDRAAVRDHVFDVLRTWRSSGMRGGAENGRALMRGRLMLEGADPDVLFTGEGYGPAPLSAEERTAGQPPDASALRDMPDWLWAQFEASLGPQAAEVAEALRHRAPVFLRVNTLRATRDTAQKALSAEQIVTTPHPLSPTALDVRENARRVATSRAYRDGLVELQDVASQAVVDALPLSSGQRVLDYCAGGGGKALAMAARLEGPVVAHDAHPARMRDVPARALRAGAEVSCVASPEGPFDLVLCDVPCSGSGAWRRAPEGKWQLSPEKLNDLCALQADILAKAQQLVAPNGVLAYATCSVLAAENTTRIDAFRVVHPAWGIAFSRQFLPHDGGDGFFITCLRRS